MTEYIIVHAEGTQPLTEKVNEYIKEGWQPLGGVTVVQIDYTEQNLGKDVRWAQAMVKE